MTGIIKMGNINTTGESDSVELVGELVSEVSEDVTGVEIVDIVEVTSNVDVISNVGSADSDVLSVGT